VPKVVEPDVGDAYGLANVLPRQVQARELPPGARADHEAVLAVTRVVVDLAQQGHHVGGNRDAALAGLRVGEVQAAVLPVDHGPRQVADLVAPQARERQELQGPHTHPIEVPLAARRDLQAAQQDLLHVAPLVGRQEALAGLHLEAANPVGGVAHIRQLPVDDDPLVETAEHAEHVVRRTGRVLHAGVERLRVAAGHALEVTFAEHGQDVLG
jgi:hypothetical protein